MTLNGVEIPEDTIADFCRRHHIRRLSLFGSILRSDYGPNSDIDVLVEFDPEYIPGLAFFGMEEELSHILGRKVDFNTKEWLSRYFRDEVLAEAAVVYLDCGGLPPLSGKPGQLGPSIQPHHPQAGASSRTPK